MLKLLIAVDMEVVELQPDSEQIVKGKRCWTLCDDGYWKEEGGGYWREMSLPWGSPTLLEPACEE